MEIDQTRPGWSDTKTLIKKKSAHGQRTENPNRGAKSIKIITKQKIDIEKNW